MWKGSLVHFQGRDCLYWVATSFAFAKLNAHFSSLLYGGFWKNWKKTWQINQEDTTMQALSYYNIEPKRMCMFRHFFRCVYHSRMSFNGVCTVFQSKKYVLPVGVCWNFVRPCMECARSKWYFNDRAIKIRIHLAWITNICNSIKRVVEFHDVAYKTIQGVLE